MNRREVLVAGGTGGLGVAVVRALLADGWAVTSTWVTEAERGRAAEALGDRTEFRLAQADVTEPDAVARVLADIGELHAVVNLVGGYAAAGRLHETPVETFQHLLSVNLLSTFVLARATVPVLLAGGGGPFVAVSARAAVRPFPGGAAYSTAKAAVLALVRALDADYRKQGLRANAVLPGVIDTPANRAAQPDADASLWVSPKATADVIAFLVSERSHAITGAAVPVAGLS